MFDDSKATSGRFVKSMGVLSGEVVDDFCATFARIPSQSVYAAKAAGCPRIVIHRFHQYVTHGMSVTGFLR